MTWSSPWVQTNNINYISNRAALFILQQAKLDLNQIIIQTHTDMDKKAKWP